MSQLQTFTTPPTKRIVSQIIELVAASALDLCAHEVPEGNLTTAYYRHVLKAEVKSYLARVGVDPKAPVGLTVASGGTGSKAIDGFILHLPEIGSTNATTVSYMAVRKSVRGHGIGRQLVDHVRAKRPIVYLDCKVGRLAYFESLGFQILKTFRNHFVLCTQSGREAGLIATVNIDNLQREPQTIQILNDLAAIHGREAVQRDLRIVLERDEAAIAQAERLLADRLAARG